jgi:4-hydroxybenzoate polyprenyltransferase
MKNNFFRKFFIFWFFSSLHISIAATFWGVITFILLGLKFNFSLLIIFFITFFVYNLNRMGIEESDKINYPERVEFALKYGKLLLYLSIIFYIFAVLLAFLYNILVMLLTVLPFFIILLYDRVKKFFLIKSLIIGILWASSVILVAASLNTFNTTVFSFFLFVFLRDFINSIFFDIRDVSGDKVKGIKTLPVEIGVKKTLFLLKILNIFSGFLLIIFVIFKLLPVVAYSLIGLVFYNMIYYELYKRKINKILLYDVIADSEIYFAAFLIIITAKLFGIL